MFCTIAVEGCFSELLSKSILAGQELIAVFERDDCCSIHCCGLKAQLYASHERT